MKRIIIFVIVAAAILVGLVILRGRGIKTKIEPANMSPEDKTAMVAAVYHAAVWRRSRTRTQIYLQSCPESLASSRW